MSLSSAPALYRIDGIEVDLSRGKLTRDGQEVHLKPKTFQILLHLIANRHRLVSRQELMDLFWKDAAVTDDALIQCIGEIRKSFQDDARNPRYLKTVPKRGYRFLAEVRTEALAELAGSNKPLTSVVSEEVTIVEVNESYTPQRHRLTLVIAAAIVILAALYFFLPRHTSDQPPPGRRLVVVLPFENRTGQSDLDWLRDGLPDMLTATLTRSPAVDVLSRQQAALWLGRVNKPGLTGALEAAKRSHAQLAIVGSFAQLGSSIRVDAQVYDSQTGKLLAAQGITAGTDQVLHQIDYLSARLAASLRTPHEDDKRDLASLMTNSLEAYRNYELGLRLVESFQIPEGIDSFKKAITLDPEFVMAYARIGYAHVVDGSRLEEGLPYLEKAFHMGSRLPAKDRQNLLAWYALANADYPSAIRRYSELIAAYPNETEAYLRLANLLRGESREAESIPVLRQALAIDPEDPKLYNALAASSSELGHHAEAIAAARQYAALAPADVNALDSLGLAYQFAGQYDDALAAYSKAITLKPDFDIARIHRAQLHWQMGRIRDALREGTERAPLATTDVYRARFWDQVALQNWRLGRRANAVTAMQNAIRYYPKSRKVSNPAILLMSPVPKEIAIQPGRAARFSNRSQYFLAAQEARLRNHPDEMLEFLRETVRAAPAWGSGEILEDALADGYRDLGRWDEAIAEYRRALALFPGIGSARFHLAQCLRQKGRQEEAKEQYRLFLQVWNNADPDLPEILEARRYTLL